MSDGRVVVVGLGPAGPELVNRATDAAIARVAERYLRTRRHPAAQAVPDAQSFDDVYESADTFEAVYRTIVDELVTAAGQHGEVLYAVPGSPAVLERSVDLLRGRDDVDVEIVPAMSFVDLVWLRLGVDPVESGARLVDGHEFAVGAAGERGPMLVGHCHAQQVLSDIKLAVDLEDPPVVTVLQRLGLPDERVFEVPWAELDRSFEPDHLTCLWIPRLAEPVAAEVARFDELVRTLRRECPWDREQTHRSLARHLLEESYEVLDAVAALGPDGQGDELLEEELGDLLFQIVFHATLARERGAFGLADVATGIHDKLVARHPHVFGDTEAADTGAVLRNWEQLKQAEKGRASVMDGIPQALPALLYAEKVQRKAARSGFPTPAEAPFDDEVSLGERLFQLVALARRLDVDPEAALRTAAGRYETEFRQWERYRTRG